MAVGLLYQLHPVSFGFSMDNFFVTSRTGKYFCGLIQRCIEKKSWQSDNTSILWIYSCAYRFFISYDYKQLHRLLSKLGRHKLYFEFSIGFEEAKKYRQANGQILRRNQWQDLTCQVYIWITMRLPSQNGRRIFWVCPVSARSIGWKSRIRPVAGRVSQRQGCPPWGGIWRKPDFGSWKASQWANLWPDEQKSHIRLWTRVSLPNKTKPNSYTESLTVNATGKEGKNVWVPGEVLRTQGKKNAQ